MGILRGFEEHQLPSLLGACVEGGLINLEITMNSAGAPAQIARAVDLCRGAMNIGAGTVTNQRLLDQALAAGASFIVTPTIDSGVVSACVARGVPCFPGAFSPTEAFRAWELGATMIKIFPADHPGPVVLQSIKEVMPFLRIMPTGGVDLDTIAAFVRAGADAFGLGNPLFDRQRIDAGDWKWLTARCRAFAQAWRQAKS